jgi:hypothetical protein
MSEYLVVAADETTVYVFKRGPDDELMYKSGSLASGVWSMWKSLGGKLYRGAFRELVTAVSSRPGRMDVVALWEDSTPRHIATTGLPTGTGEIGGPVPHGSSWTQWQSLGGKLERGLTMVSWGPNRLDVFGQGTDHAVHSKSWNGSSWSTWSSLGGIIVGIPQSISRGQNSLDVLAIGTDYGLYQKSWDGSRWSDWQRVTDCISDILVTAPAGPRLELLVQGNDLNLWHNFYGMHPSSAAGPKPPACPCGREGQFCCAYEACGDGSTCNRTNNKCESPAQATPPPTAPPGPQTPPPVPPVPSTREICSTEEPEPGWVIVNDRCVPDHVRCGPCNPSSPGYGNVYVTANTAGKAINETMDICSINSTIPSGWEIATSFGVQLSRWDPGRCGRPSDLNARNLMTIVRRQ